MDKEPNIGDRALSSKFPALSPLCVLIEGRQVTIVPRALWVRSDSDSTWRKNMRSTGVIAVMPKVGTKMAISSGKELILELRKDANKDLTKTLKVVAILIIRNRRQ